MSTQTQTITRTKTTNSANNTNNSRVITLAELGLHGYTSADNKQHSIWTSIHGNVYDITEFINSLEHPGGPVIRIACGIDATCLFESYHPGYSTNKINGYLNSKCKQIGVLQDYVVTDNKFFLTVRERVENHLKSIKMDRHYIQAISLSEAFITVMLYLAITVYVGLYCSYGWCIVLGILTGRLGFLMHTGNHCGASSNIAINRILGYFMDLIGSTNVIWSHEHQVAHHIDPNHHGFDNDCEIGNPFFRFHPSIPWHPMQQYQHITTPIAMSIGFIKWYLSDFGHYLAGTVGHVKLNITAHDWIVLFLFKICWFCLHFLIPLYYHGIKHALGLALLSMIVGAHYLENTFIVNHIQHGLVPPNNAHWANKQVLATTNWKSGSKLSNFISGGLNHQIEHHLFPSVSTWLYPEISGIVKQTCEEFNLPYFNYLSFWDAWFDMISYLKAMGNKDFQPSNYTSRLVKAMKLN